MTSAVRARRTTPTVAVTGAAGRLGAAVVPRLIAAGVSVIGIDTHRRPLPGVSWRIADVRDPALASRLTGIDSVVHLATDRALAVPAADRRAVNVRGTEVLLDAAVAAGVRRAVLLTSAAVYGATAANRVPLDEDAALCVAGHEGLVGDWLGMEQAAERHAGDLHVTVLRPASLVGDVVDVLMPGMFEAVRLLAIRDGRCCWQFCHTDDLAEATVYAATGQVCGAVTVGCDGWLERADVERVSGLRSVVLPAGLAAATAQRLHRIGALNSPASDLDYLTHPWVVGSQRLHAAGWQPQWTNEDALRAHLAALGDSAGRGLLVVDRKDATRAAAGATLAIVGSLALARLRSRNRA